ncbi:MAG TPA: response regulator [Bacteroidota bacterium]|nr:response regulator [Bacteroidota bacterium]
MTEQFRYESVLESISGGFFALDNAMNITYWNRAAEEGTGLAKREVLGKNVFEIFPNAEGAELGEKYRLAMSTRTFQSIETRYKDDRFEAWYDVRIYPAEDGLSVFFQDITGKKNEIRRKEILVDISRVINGSQHIDELCVRAAEKIALLFEIPSHLACVYLYDPRGNEIRLVAPALMDVDFAQDVVHQQVREDGVHPAARVAQTRQVLVTDELTQGTLGPLYPGLIAEQHLKSLIVFPLTVQGELQGILEVFSVKQPSFLDEEMETLQVVANDLAGGMNRKRLIDELRMKNLELEGQTQKTLEASDTLKKFLATFSHELRSPLNSIIGFSDLLTTQLEGLPPETVRNFMKNISTSGRHLQQIINDILDLSKIEAGKMELHVASYPVSYFEESVMRVLSAALAEKKISLEFRFPPDIEELVVDQTRFGQILINLVSNAVKFSHPEGTVCVSFQRVDNDLQFSVSDSGIGIPPEDVAGLFKPFKQAPGGREMNRQGIGLGLAITKKLVELHGGSIWVESEAGEGTTMHFRIPMIVDAGSERMVQAGMLLEALERQNRSTAEGAEKPLALVIEDAPQAGELLRMHIESAGYRVEIARNGSDAVDMAKRLRPNVITLDLLLPVKDGWQVLKELKRHPLCKHIPVIIVSIIDEKSLGFSLGAVEYFVKPVNRDELVQALDRVHILPRSARQKPAVLIIDDDKAATDLIHVMLENEGYRVFKAFQGKEGVEIATRERPDLIILDLIMPETSGFNVAYQLKQIPATRDIPIIILTSMEIDNETQEQLGSYVSGLMNKGAFTKKDLLREIGNIENARLH